MATYYGDYCSTKGGKFRLKVVATFTTSGISWTPYVCISNAFDSAQEFKLTYYNINGEAKTRSSTAGGTKKLKSVNTSGAALPTYSYASFKIPKKISLTLGGKTSSIAGGTIVSTLQPTSPTISVDKSSPALWKIRVSGTGSVGQPVNKVYLQYAEKKSPVESDWGNESYDTFTATTGAYSATFTLSVGDDEVYRFRAKASGSSTGTEVLSGWTVDSGVYYSNPGSSNSDTEQVGSNAVVTWNADITAIANGTITGWNILRSTNGGAYVRVATVYASQTQSSYSWTDTSCIAGNTYQYKTQAFGNGGTSWDDGSGGSVVKPVPASPTSVVAVRGTRSGSTDAVTVTISGGSSSTVDTVILERQIDSTGWAAVATEDYPYTTYTGAVTTALESFQFRAKFRNSTGDSSYTYSELISARLVPLAPSLVTPVANAIVPLDDGSVTLKWNHRPQDGMPQYQAKIEYEINNDGSWAQHTYYTSNMYYSLNIQTLSPGDTITWRVSTRTEALSTYSPTSEERSFLVQAKPQISITAPTTTVTTLPLVISYNYNDRSGNLVSLAVSVIKDNKVISKTYDNTERSSGSYTYQVTSVLFESEKEYDIRLEAISSSGLTTSDMITAVFDYDPIALDGGLVPVITNDSDTGYATIYIARDIGDDGQTSPLTISLAYLYRYANGERILMGEVKEGYQIVDKYAPVNKEYSYELIMLTSTDEVSIVRVNTDNDSRYSFIYYGNEKMAKARWNPTLKTSLTRPEKVQVRYSGRTYPVSYDTKAKEETATFTALLEPDELEQFIDVMDNGGSGIWKSVQGRCFDADFELDYSRVDKSDAEIYNCSLKVTRVEV